MVEREGGRRENVGWGQHVTAQQLSALFRAWVSHGPELIHQAGQPASSRILLSMPPALALGLQMNPASLAFLLGSGDRSLVSVCIASPLLTELCRYVP